MQNLIQNLRRLRLDKGYTQERLAEALGVSPQAVSRWECGSTLPDVLQLPRLARLYGVTVDDLYREQASAYPNYAQRLLAVYEQSARSEDFLAAEQEFIRLLAGDHSPDDLRAFGVLCQYMAQRCAAQAEEYLNAAMEAAPHSHWVWSSAAQQKISLLSFLGRGEAEAARYRRAAEQVPGDPLNWILAVFALHSAGQTEEAYHLSLQALERFPEDPILHIHAGDICRSMNLYEDAFRHWEQARALDRNCLDPLYAMGECCEELSDFSRGYEIWSRLHQSLIARGMTQEARYSARRKQHCLDQMKG